MEDSCCEILPYNDLDPITRAYFNALRRQFGRIDANAAAAFNALVLLVRAFGPALVFKTDVIPNYGDADFDVENPIYPGTTPLLLRNGSALRPITDFTVSTDGRTISTTFPPIPGDVFIAYYQTVAT